MPLVSTLVIVAENVLFRIENTRGGNDNKTDKTRPPPSFANANFAIRNTLPIIIAGCFFAYFFQVRGIEITIVVLVLMVWIGAIIMFFNRWGKIRMLIPYQPDYKDTQLKVPGTGACNPVNTCQNQTGTGFCCSQVGTTGLLNFFCQFIWFFFRPEKRLYYL